MRGFTLAVLISLAGAGIIEAQIDWPSFGGDSQRTGWERSDTRITRENVKGFELVLKRKFPDVKAGPRSLTPPVVMGLLISYRGFKELAFAAGGSNAIWSLDADLNRVFWKRQFETRKSRHRRLRPDRCHDARSDTSRRLRQACGARSPQAGSPWQRIRRSAAGVRRVE